MTPSDSVTSLANREKNREFFNFGLDRGLEHPLLPMIPGLLRKVPYSTEQGIILVEQRVSAQKQGIFSVKSVGCSFCLG
jgi:hypothetical protein